VKYRIGSLAWFVSPIRAWGQRLTIVLLAGAAIGLLTLEKTSPDLAERARGAAADMVTPILDLMSRPSAATAEAIDGVRELGRLRTENEQLREELSRLLQWQTVARRLDAENQQLRTLLHLAPDPRARFVTARVVGGSGGAFVRSVLIAAGERDGVRKNQSVITGEGLVGRVSEVGDRSARVLLLTDINSRVPVFVERTRERAVLAGDNSNSMQLLYLTRDVTAHVGDRIITSGHGGVFPPGLPVGVVTAIDNGVVSVQPYVNWEQLEYVRLVDYELADLLQPTTEPLRARGPR
jgi:rod shape-determining protein MreC